MPDHLIFVIVTVPDSDSWHGPSNSSVAESDLVDQPPRGVASCTLSGTHVRKADTCSHLDDGIICEDFPTVIAFYGGVRPKAMCPRKSQGVRKMMKYYQPHKMEEKVRQLQVGAHTSYSYNSIFFRMK